MSGEIRRLTNEFLAPSLSQDEPNIPVERASGEYFYGTDGKKYLDFVSGMASCNIGHCHPKVVKAAQKQLELLIHGPAGVVMYEPLLELSSELSKITPGNINMFFYLNAGSEAVDGAIKMAKYITNRPAVISFIGGFHGRTFGATTFTTSKAKYRYHYEPLLPSVYYAPFAYCYRCPLDKKADTCNTECIKFIDTIFDHLANPDEVAAFLLEPIQGEGGYIVPPQKWLKALREICDRYGIMLVFDEVQSGFGRTGDWFAAQTFDVVPDIIAIAKSIASGLPLSAIGANSDLMKKWAPPGHGTTFGGNPVSCAAALATLEVFREENVLRKTKQNGEKIMQRLNSLKNRTDVIGDIRGKGMMIGIEFIKPNTDREPNPEIVTMIVDTCLQNGLILYKCGLHSHVIRFIPPLTVSEDALEKGLTIFEEAVLMHSANLKNNMNQ
ncbi:MAG: aspartate aminotransferase family protein [Tepidanaerobacteraceae bacterium]|jgi:4-aminobutyrate aminotransferase